MIIRALPRAPTAPRRVGAGPARRVRRRPAESSSTMRSTTMTTPDRTVRWPELRKDAVVAALRGCWRHRVVDLGCGEGALAARPARRPDVHRGRRGRRVGARSRHAGRNGSSSTGCLTASAPGSTLFQSSLIYRDARIAGYDAIVLMEVVEHVDPDRLPALERTVFGAAAPRTVVVTTPNAEHNVRYEGLAAGRDAAPRPPVRVDAAASSRPGRRGRGRYGYCRRVMPDRRDDPEVGPPTQLAVFTKSRRGGMPEPCRHEPTSRFPSSAWWRWSASPGRASRRSPATTSARFEVISSDFCRGLVADDENDQARHQ